MYNKLFTKILDSSIWLESMPTRIVWLTFIAAMDEHGFCQFASVANVAHRARVSLPEADEAIKCLEGADPNSSDPDNEGRRLERVPGGWMVLNSEKHRHMVTRAIIQEQTRERVRRHRDKVKRNSNAPVTPSEAEAEAGSEATTETTKTKSEERGGGVIVSAIDYEKAKRHNAYIGARLRIPHKLHNDFVAALGGESPDTTLRAWYAAVDEEIERTREAIVPDVWKFMERRFKAWAVTQANDAAWAEFDAKYGKGA